MCRLIAQISRYESLGLLQTHSPGMGLALTLPDLGRTWAGSGPGPLQGLWQPRSDAISLWITPTALPDVRSVHVTATAHPPGLKPKSRTHLIVAYFSSG